MDVEHAMDKINHDAAADEPEERKRKCIAAAPAYLKDRVDRGEEIPRVELFQILHDKNDDEEEGDVVAATFLHVMMRDKLLPEHFVELMEYLVPRFPNH